MGMVPMRWEPSWVNVPQGKWALRAWDCGQQGREEEEEKLFPDTQGRYSSAGGSRLLEEVLAGLCLCQGLETPAEWCEADSGADPNVGHCPTSGKAFPPCLPLRV